MSFWFRELAGWFLVGVGLCAFALTVLLGLGRHLFVLPAVLIFGIFIFRGGIHLLKVAIAARLAMRAQERLYPQAGNDPPRRAT
jgi:hypothetical protein